MHTRLVANLDHGSQRLIERGAHSTNYGILGLIREVRCVEIGEIVILDPVVERATGEAIEHRLINSARKNQPIREIEVACYRKHLHQWWCRTQDRDQVLA